LIIGHYEGSAADFVTDVTDGRRKKEEGRRKKEEGRRRKKEEVRSKMEEGRRKREERTAKTQYAKRRVSARTLRKREE
jgi:hypothetical protein